MRLAVLVLVLPACFGKSKSGPITGTLTTGAIVTRDAPAEVAGVALAMTERENMTGVELRMVAAAHLEEPGIPNAYGYSVRQVGTGVQHSLQAGWMLAHKAGAAMLFARATFDMLSWTKRGEDVQLSALSPTAEVGIAPWGRGICVSASGTWDVYFNDPDRGLVGVFVGLCGGALADDN
jgi:hypothetical protein